MGEKSNEVAVLDSYVSKDSVLNGMEQCMEGILQTTYPLNWLNPIRSSGENGITTISSSKHLAWTRNGYGHFALLWLLFLINGVLVQN